MVPPEAPPEMAPTRPVIDLVGLHANCVIAQHTECLNTSMICSIARPHGGACALCLQAENVNARHAGQVSAWYCMMSEYDMCTASQSQDEFAGG